MPCDFFRLRDGTTGIVCSRGTRGRRKCVVCGREATLLCDWPRGTRTCSAPLCAGCAFQPDTVRGLDDSFDLCPKHRETYEAKLAGPTQLSLFRGG